MNAIDSYVADQGDRMLDELKALLRIPSVSTSPEHADECRRAGDWVADHLRSLGCEKIEKLGSETHPVIHAETRPRTSRRSATATSTRAAAPTTRGSSSRS
jgi:acetylornithine deacetylase/succinyl-diaminopimelate desuccinylase-like protein